MSTRSNPSSSPMWRSASSSPRTLPYALRPVPYRRANYASQSSPSTPQNPSPGSSSFAFNHLVLPQNANVQTGELSPTLPPAQHSSSSSSNSSPPYYNRSSGLIKPQALKMSPFASISSSLYSNTTSKNVPVKSTPSTSQHKPSNIFEKWSTSFSRVKSPNLIQSKTPTAHVPKNESPLPAHQHSQLQYSLRSSSMHSINSHGFTSPRDTLNISSNQPINLTGPNSVSSERFTPLAADAPLDLRSPAPPYVPRTTPVVPPARTPQSSYVFGSMTNMSVGMPKFSPGQTKGSTFGCSSFPTTSPGLFGFPDYPNHGSVVNPTGKSPAAARSTPDMIQEATGRLHSMSLRNYHQQIKQQDTEQTSNFAPVNVHSYQHANSCTGGLHVNGISSPRGRSAADSMFGPEDHKMTLFYPSTPSPKHHQQQINGKARAGSLQQQSSGKLLALLPQPMGTFRGLGTKVMENSTGDKLADRLEENYLKCRNLLVNREGLLMTPLKFLNTLCYRMNIGLHAETFRFLTDSNDTQFRTELYVGGYCGVGHALYIGFSRQLAAAHLLERMRIHFKGIKLSSYALFPGSRYTKIEDKLKQLCKTYDLGEVQMVYNDRLNVGAYGHGPGGRRGFGNGGDLEVRWECSCFVKNLQATALSDHKLYGLYQAAKEMYMNFVKPPEVPVVQIKDYFSVGVECPMLKDIHCSVLLNIPSINKFEWMEEYEVPPSQIDNVLQDPTNNSKYLMKRYDDTLAPFMSAKRTTEKNTKLATFRLDLEEALEWMQGTVRRTNVQGMRFRQSKRQELAATTAPMDTGDTFDENDAEVEEIFHDACMDIEL